MKKIIISFILLQLCQYVFCSHPVHVSVTNINIDNLLVSITISTFADDWETAYFHYYGDTINFRSQRNIEKGWFISHLNESFVLRVSDSERLNLKMDSVYYNELAIKIEMHVKLSANPKTLYIYNSILTDIFADQTNLLIYSIAGKEKGIQFDYHKKEEVLNLR